VNENGVEQELEQLRDEHRKLDSRISEMCAQPSLNQLELARLKRRKLWLKDAIEQLRDQTVPDIIA
jgi:hypothetical protein